MFLSLEKDRSSMEFDFVVTPEQHDRRRRHEEDDISSSLDSTDKNSTILIQEDDECKFLVSSKECKNPNFQESSQETKNVHGEEDRAEEVDDGFKTPTSLENKIPAALKCPPAPMKPKSLPLSKRKCPARRRVLLNLSNEIESLFPPEVLKDLINGKIKKVRKEFHR